jgi:spermidine/putrescine transport system permease protein
MIFKNLKNSKNSNYNKRTFSLFVFVGTLVFFYIPLLLLIIFSFNKGKNIQWTGFSLHWYYDMIFRSRDLWQAFLNSLLISITSATLATFIGTFGGIGFYWHNFKFKKILQFFTYLPLVIPEIIMGVSLLIFFAGIKWKLGLLTIFIAHTTFCIPFVILIIMSRLEEFDNSIIEASYDLGANEWQTLTKIILPVTMPGIIASFLMAMTLSLDDFVITFFVAGPGSSTLPLHIYSMIRFGISPVINVFSVFLIGLTIILTLSTNKIQKYMLK